MKITNVCKDRALASDALARHSADVLRAAISQRGKATFVVSGGTSPAEMFARLRTEDLDWSRVTILLSDERLVDSQSDERNETMVRRLLMTDNASRATLVSLVSDPEDPATCEQFANSNLASVEQPFDLVILGMGEDGHTASLFPDAPALSDALQSDASCIVQEVPSQDRIRISLTPKALLNSREVVLLVFGESKHKVLEQAAENGPVAQYPVRIVLHQSSVPVKTYWAP